MDAAFRRESRVFVRKSIEHDAHAAVGIAGCGCVAEGVALPFGTHGDARTTRCDGAHAQVDHTGFTGAYPDTDRRCNAIRIRGAIGVCQASEVLVRAAIGVRHRERERCVASIRRKLAAAQMCRFGVEAQPSGGGEVLRVALQVTAWSTGERLASLPVGAIYRLHRCQHAAGMSEYLVIPINRATQTRIDQARGDLTHRCHHAPA
ncbi:hypothetical protein D3C75_778540 [compost metagenome]